MVMRVTDVCMVCEWGIGEHDEFGIGILAMICVWTSDG